MFMVALAACGVDTTPLLPGAHVDAIDAWYPRSAAARRALANATYELAFQVEARLAWRYVTAAAALDPTHRAAVEQVVAHYAATNGEALARAQLERTLVAAARDPSRSALHAYAAAELLRSPAGIGVDAADDLTVDDGALNGAVEAAHFLFASPIMRFALERAERVRAAGSFAAFNFELAAVATAEYAATAAALPASTAPRGVNNAFYERQMAVQRMTGHALPSLAALPAFVALEAATRAAFARYLVASAGVFPAAARAATSAPQRLVAWLSVLQPGAFSERHIHGDQSLVGAYYARVPAGGGHLVFEDPRGTFLKTLAWPGGDGSGRAAAPPAPPFVRSFAIAPRCGDIVVFPGFLAHRVERGAWPLEGGLRVAVVFGLLGEWDVVGASASLHAGEGQRSGAGECFLPLHYTRILLTI